MIIRCDSCASALIYDIALGKMKCKYCDSVYGIDKVYTPASEQNMMESELYLCTACSARLMINDSESVTYCAYCGQPTVVFERVTKMYKPQKILPFTVTKAGTL